MNQAAIDQLIDQLVAQPFDVHRAAPGEMKQRLLALGRAIQAAGATRHRLAFQPHHMRAALGTDWDSFAEY